MLPGSYFQGRFKGVVEAFGLGLADLKINIMQPQILMDDSPLAGMKSGTVRT